MDYLYLTPEELCNALTRSQLVDLCEELADRLARSNGSPRNDRHLCAIMASAAVDVFYRRDVTPSKRLIDTCYADVSPTEHHNSGIFMSDKKMFQLESTPKADDLASSVSAD